MRHTILALALLAGCLDPSLVPCGDLSCPAGSVCTASGCALPGDVAACDGLADGTACKTAIGAGGTCVGGACRSGLCGNGVLDPGEACDDGNTVSGDGCSGDCKKIEVCGDGIVDVGEGCDDGNTNPADGCDHCVPTTWIATALVGGSLEATMVGLSSPSGVAVDRSGNIFIADTNNELIRRVDTTGVITTIAGTGTSGYSGDGGVATSAQLASPQSVAVDGLGNVYIADTGNHAIRRVDVNGIITTIAGTGVAGFSGDNGPATSAQLAYPYGVAVDGLGVVYIADTNNNVVRRVDLAGTITTFAGDGDPYYAGDGGPATSAGLSAYGVALDAAGNLYIADPNNGLIWKVDATGTINSIAGNGSGGDGGIDGQGDGGSALYANILPQGVAVDAAGNVLIADTYDYRIRRVDTNGIITTIAGNGDPTFGGDGGPAIDANVAYPNGIAVDLSGNMIIADTGNQRVRKIDPAGTITTISGGTSSFPQSGDSATVLGIATRSLGVDASGNTYLVDYSSTVYRVDPMGVITAASAVNNATCIAVDGAGNLYVGEGAYAVVVRIDTNGTVTTIAGNGSQGSGGDNGPATSAQIGFTSALAVDAAGNVYIADEGSYRIRKVDTNGIITTVAGTGTFGGGGDGGLATQANLSIPFGLAVDATGNLYIADSANQEVRRVDTNGMITAFAGTGTAGPSGDGGLATAAQLSFPTGLAVDSAGNVLIADRDNQRVRRVDTTGMISTIAGTGAAGFSGDGGAATSAQLYDPVSVAVDPLGRVVIADLANSRVARIDTAGVITTIVGGLDPVGVGPVARGTFSDARALALAPPLVFVASADSGTVEAASATWLGVVAGRYPQAVATGALARFRTSSFGAVTGISYDAAAGKLYLSESSANRIHVVTIVDATNPNTWTIATVANASGTAGFADGDAMTAQFRGPAGLFIDGAAGQLYVADTGNHVIRAIDLATSTVRTVAGTPATRGFFGDGGPATSALLYQPKAITECPNGDLFIADTSNERVRRISNGTITTVLGVGVPASSGEGSPASMFPVNAPLGLACDAIGNVFVTSTTTVRLMPSDAMGVVDGTGDVQTIYGLARKTFPASVTTCLTGLAVAGSTTVDIVDSCTGLLVELDRQAR